MAALGIVCPQSFDPADFSYPLQGQAFDRDSGMKWPIAKLKQYLQTIHGAATVMKMFHDIQMTVAKSLLAVQDAVVQVNAPFCCQLCTKWFVQQ